MAKTAKHIIKNKVYGCDKCNNNGYILTKQSRYSIATICDCYNCDKCSNTGKIQYYSDSGYSFLRPCENCGILHKNIKLYNISGKPAKYFEFDEVDTFNPREFESHRNALKYVKEFVLQYPHKKGFILMGPAGVGKTHLAVTAISELTLHRGIKCVFKEFFELLNELKKAYTEGTSESNIIQPLIDTEVLVIDELGKGRANEWELSVLDQLISSRYNSSKTTLLTTNYIDRKTNEKHNKDKDNKEILENRVGERISSRLYEMCKFIYLEGRDFRFEKYE